MSQQIATVVSVENDVVVTRADGSVQPVNVGDVLFSGDLVRTLDGASLTLETADLELIQLLQQQSLLISTDMLNASEPSSDENSVAQNSVQDILNLLDGEGDILQQVDATAAGTEAGLADSGSSFVRLLRIVESVDPVSFNFAAVPDDDIQIPEFDGDLFTAASITITGPDTIIEGQPIPITVSVSVPALQDLTITLSNGLVVIIPAGQTSVTIEIDSRPDDAYLQGDIAQIISVVDASGGGFSQLDTSTSHTVTVADDSDITGLTLSAPAQVVEGELVTVTATVTNPPQGSDLLITLNNGQQIIIAAGQTQGSISFLSRPDDVYQQGDATQQYSISEVQGGNYEALDTSSTASTTVTDDADATVVTLSAPAQVVEGELVTVTATVTNPPQGSDLLITLNNGQQIIIAAGQTQGSISFLSRPDDVYQQGDATQQYSISEVQGGNYEALDTSSTASTTVIDDADATVVTLSAPAQVVEGELVTVTATVTNPPQGSDLLITLNNGQQIIIAAGQTQGSISFLSRPDDVYQQGDATQQYSISEVQGGNYEALDTSSTASTTVTDDQDPVNVTLTADISTLPESGGNIIYTATLQHPSQGVTIIETTLGTITIGDGQQSGTLVYALAPEDDVYIDPRTLENEILSASGGNFEALTFDNTVVQVAITDTVDAVTVVLSADKNTAAENEATTFTVTLHDENGNEVVALHDVMVTLSDGRQVAINAGTSSASWQYTQGDDVYIDSETYQLNITSASQNVATGTAGSFEQLLTDNTQVSVNITDTIDETSMLLLVDKSAIANGAATGDVTYTIVLSHPAQTGLTVNTAQGDIIIAAGQSTGSITVNQPASASNSITGYTGGNFEQLTDKTGVLDVPVAVDDTIPVAEGAAAVSGNVMANDLLTTGTQLHTFTYTNDNGVTVTEVFSDTATSFTVATQTGQLTVSQDGSWSFQPVDSFDHDAGVPADAGSFSYTLIDANNDISNSAKQTITVTDTEATTAPDNIIVNEAHLPAGKEADASKLAVTEQLNITKGQDAITDVKFSSAQTALESLNLTSGGAPLSYQLSADGHTLTATADGKTIFTVQLSNADDASGASQSYTFTLQGTLDHASAADSVNLSFVFDVTDIDSTLYGQSFTVTVLDDAPVAVSQAEVVVTEGDATFIGNNLLDNDLAGADGMLTLTSFSYTDVSGNTATAPAGMTVTTQYGSLTVNADGSWSYTPTAELQHLSSDELRESFTYTIVDADGDTASAIQSIVVLDGANPAIDAPTHSTLHEKFLPRGTEPDSTQLSQTGSLGVVRGSDAIKVVTLDHSQPALDNLNLTSAGTPLQYSVSADGSTLTARTADANTPVFTVVLNNPTDASAGYKFTLVRPLDHISADELDLAFSFTVTDADNDTTTGSFVVTIVDDVPPATQLATVNEDSAVTINTSADGKGNISTGTLPEYGTVTINSTGTITYTPKANYSGTDSFTYVTTNEDGTLTTTTVNVTVNPLADAPDLGTVVNVITPEDTAVALGLNAPVVTDATDQNAAEAGDNPELLGLISLTGIPNGATLQFGTTTYAAKGSAITVYLTDADNHIAIDPATATLQMTKAEFEALMVTPPANSHVNFAVTLRVTSYEVDASGKPLPDVAGAESSATVRVNVQAVTDGANSFTLAEPAGGFVIAEDNSLVLTSALSQSFTDKDGSEKRWYTVEGLPAGASVYIGSKTYTVGADGKIVSDKANITNDNMPVFRIKPPANFSGELTGIKITLHVQDNDSDSVVTTDILTKEVTINKITITPVAGDVAIDKPNTGIEDTSIALFKQLNGNSVFRLTDIDGSEQISKVGISKADLSASGATLELNGATVSIEVINNVEYYIFDLASYLNVTITPPANSSHDIKINYLVETTDTSGALVDTQVKVLEKIIEVKAVSEELVSGSQWNTAKNYGVLGDEDSWVALTGLYANNPDIIDSPYPEHTTGLFSLTDPALVGSALQYTDSAGTVHTLYFNAVGSVIQIPAEYLNTVQFKATDYFSGNVVLDMRIKTEDFDDDNGAAAPAWTSVAVKLEFDIAAVANEITLKVAQAHGLEDTAIPLKISASSADNDGSEKFTITISDIPAGAVLHYNGTILNVTAGSVTIENFDNNAPFTITAPAHSNNDFVLKVEGYSVDGSDTSAPYSLDLKVNVKGVADNVQHTELNIETAQSVSGSSHSFNAVVTETALASGPIVLNTLFSAAAAIASEDTDGSETITVIVTGLADGFVLNNAIFMGGSGESRKWSMTLDEFKQLGANSITITSADPNFSGVIDFTVGFVVTENDGHSHTSETKQISVLVTPVADAILNSGTTSAEDSRTKLTFALNQPAGETDEMLDIVWIKAADINNADFTVYLGTEELLNAGVVSEVIAGEVYLKLSSAEFNNLYVQFKAQLGDASHQLDVRYQVSDSVATTNGTFTDTQVKSGSYTLTNIPVTDDITAQITDLSGIDTDISSSDVTANNNTTVNVSLHVSSADIDGSEALVKLVIEGVPTGVYVAGATYIGQVISAGAAEPSGVWVIDVPADAVMDADGVTNQLQFVIDGQPTEGAYAIQITAHNQDGSAAITTATTGFNLVIPADFDASDAGAQVQPPAVDLVVSDLTEITEDTAFALSDVVSISSLATSATNFSITIQGLENVTIPGAEIYTVNGQTVYVIHGAGAVQTVLDAITITPDANFNSNDSASLKLDVVLTTYQGSAQHASVVNVVKDVTPVTDPLTLTTALSYVDEDGNTTDKPLEDGRYQISINVASVDTQYTLVSSDGSSSVTDISLTHSGVGGTLSWSGGSVVLGAGTDTVNVPFAALHNLTFVPAANSHGTAAFSYELHSQEANASNIMKTSGSFSFDIQPVADGLELNNLAATGNEDSLLELKVDGLSLPDGALFIDTDGSESLQTLLLDNLPNGFLVFFGEEGALTLAHNTGENAGGNNTWNIPLQNGALPKVWLQAPENWSGTYSDLRLVTIVNDADSIKEITTQFTATWHAVADGISIAPTPSFADESATVALNLNAAMEDIDGSETVTVVLGAATALPAGFVFTDASGNLIDTVYDAATGSYTLSGIGPDQINNLQMTPPAGFYGKHTLTISASTVDGSSSSPAVNGQLDVTLKAVANGVTLFNLATDATGSAIVAPDAVIQLQLAGIDLIDKSGSEILKLQLSGLGNQFEPDISAMAGVSATKLANGDWLLELAAPTEPGYADAIATLQTGLSLTALQAGSVSDITVTAWSVDVNTGKISAGQQQSISLSVTVDNDTVLQATSSGDTLFGGAGADTFAWSLAEASPTPDTIVHFDATQDKLDLSSLLQNIDNQDILQHLNVTQDQADTVISVKLDKVNISQSIVLKDVDSGSFGNTESEIINHLIDNQLLKIE